MEGVIKGRSFAPRKIMVYGPPGVGKTSFACQAPNPIVIQTEQGAGDVGADRFPVCKTFEQFWTQCGQVVEGGQGYDTIVIDSLNWLEKLVHKYICDKHGAENIEDTKVKEFAYQAGYNFALDAWDNIIDKFDEMMESTGANMIMCAHSKIQEFKDPTTDNYERFVPALHVSKKGIGAGSRLQQWCDEVLFINKKAMIRTTDKGEAKAIGGEDTYIFTQGRPSFDAKNRLNLPSEMVYEQGKGWEQYAMYLKGE